MFVAKTLFSNFSFFYLFLFNMFSDLKMESLPVDVSVMPSLIEIKNGQGCKMISLPPGVSLVPSSCRGLQYVPGDGLHLRLLVQESSHASKSDYFFFFTLLSACEISRSN